MSDEAELRKIYENVIDKSGLNYPDIDGILAGKYGHEDSRFISDLDDRYQDDVPADQQGACIDYFFDDRGFWAEDQHWGGANIAPPGERTYEDDESYRQMLYVLKTFAMPEYIREMIVDWYQNGF